MSQSTNNSNFRRWRVSYVWLCSILAAWAIAYGAATFLEVKLWREQTPRLAADSLVKALRAYQRQTGHFPATLRELEGGIWKHKTPPDFGADGRGLAVANYYYIYYPVDAGSATLWIIPTGPRRNEGSTHFLLVYQERLRRWKGAPLSLDEIGQLRGVPRYNEMHLLGMTEQPPIEVAKRR